MIKAFTSHPILKIVSGSLVELPSPTNLSTWWNFGSLLGACLGLQLITGVFLAMQYTGDILLSFNSVVHLSQENQLGWFLRMCHANGASFFFFCLYFHAGRGMYYSSYRLHMTWGIGVVILLAVMAAAFLGYVLPWGQMSFWGTSVITNLLSALPVIGGDIVLWVWGGLSVGNSTLTRFFTFHFLVPFMVAAMAMVHLLFLHQTGSNNPLGLPTSPDKITFQPYFSWKDWLGFCIMLSLLWGLVLSSPWLLGDPENFIMANSLVTPIHIQPEWYFLFAYAILRSIPNKLGGVIALAMAILILLIMTMYPESKFQSLKSYKVGQAYFWGLVMSVLLLTWIGARPVEEPYVLMGQGLTVFYFSFYFLLPALNWGWDRALD